MSRTAAHNIFNWMKHNADDYRYNGELCCTRLAEAAADNFDCYEGDDYTIPEEIFDLAVDVSVVLA